MGGPTLGFSTLPANRVHSPNIALHPFSEIRIQDPGHEKRHEYRPGRILARWVAREQPQCVVASHKHAERSILPTGPDCIQVRLGGRRALREFCLGSGKPASARFLSLSWPTRLCDDRTVSSPCEDLILLAESSGSPKLRIEHEAISLCNYRSPSTAWMAAAVAGGSSTSITNLAYLSSLRRITMVFSASCTSQNTRSPS
jgi:hypothetical protein